MKHELLDQIGDCLLIRLSIGDYINNQFKVSKLEFKLLGGLDAKRESLNAIRAQSEDSLPLEVTTYIDPLNFVTNRMRTINQSGGHYLIATCVLLVCILKYKSHHSTVCIEVPSNQK